jgi:hypothetical protein
VPKQKQPFNPFYAALVLVGVAFTVTACAYAVMMFRATKLTSPDAVEQSRLMTMLDERGVEILGIEVLLLAVATAGAIGLDQSRGRCQMRPEGPEGNSPGREAGDQLV